MTANTYTHMLTDETELDYGACVCKTSAPSVGSSSMSGWCPTGWFGSPWLNPTRWTGDEQVATATLTLALVTLWLGWEAWRARKDQGKQLVIQGAQMSSLQAPYVHPLPGLYAPDGTWDTANCNNLGARNDGKGVAWDIAGKVYWPQREEHDNQRHYGPFTLGVGNETHVHVFHPISNFGFDETVSGHFLYRDGLNHRWVTRFRFFDGKSGPLQCIVWSYERVDADGEVPLRAPPS